jgi:antitoxin MazE
MVQAKVQRWGEALAIRIPEALAREAGLEEDSSVSLTLSHGRLQIRSNGGSKRALEDLVQRITPHNVREEVDTGSPVGNEAW